ncbi:MAG TPA: DinB family protein, partial [Thermoanaerobaculia bacterium]
MNRRNLETLLLTLESTPALLERAAEAICPSEISRRPADGSFSFVENVWHLADLEREAYGVRIQRIVSEDEPMLSNFDGERIARERRYQDRDVAAGLAAFASARRRNLEALRHRATEDWKR